MTMLAETRMPPTDRVAPAASLVPSPADETLRLFAEHGPALHRFCQFTLGRKDDVEDTVQETFLKLLQHLRASGDRSNLRAWLFTVAANGCRDRLRRRSRWLPWRAEMHDGIVPPTETASDDRRALAAIGALAPRDRLLLSLRAQGLSYREIAAAASVSETSVGRFLARAIERWKKQITDRT